METRNEFTGCPCHFRANSQEAVHVLTLAARCQIGLLSGMSEEERLLYQAVKHDQLGKEASKSSGRGTF